MQNRANPCKKPLIEDIPFEEIGEKTGKFGESLPAEGSAGWLTEWKIPGIWKAAARERLKFRIYPLAVRFGQAIGYVLVRILSLSGQAIWFLVLVLSAALVFVWQALSGHGQDRHVRRHGHGQTGGQGQEDWRDVPTGWEAGNVHVRKDGQGQTNIQVNIHLKND